MVPPEEGETGSTSQEPQEPVGPRLGDDLVPETKTVVPSAVSVLDQLKAEAGDSGDAEGTESQESGEETAVTPADDFDPTTVDWAYVSEDAVPEQYKPVVAVARKAQADARALHAGTEKRLAEREAAVKALEDTKPESTAASTPQSTPEDDIAWQATMLRDMGIDNQDDWSAAANIVTIADKIVQKRLEAVNGNGNGDVAALKTEIDSLKTIIHADRISSIEAVVNAECKDAFDAYGQDEVERYGDTILAMRKTSGPNGKAFTVRTAFESLTGKTGQQVAEQKAQEKEIVTKAKKGASGAPAVAAGASDATGGGDLSETDGLAEMAAVIERGA